MKTNKDLEALFDRLALRASKAMTMDDDPSMDPEEGPTRCSMCGTPDEAMHQNLLDCVTSMRAKLADLTGDQGWLPTPTAPAATARGDMTTSEYMAYRREQNLIDGLPLDS